MRVNERESSDLKAREKRIKDHNNNNNKKNINKTRSSQSLSHSFIHSVSQSKRINVDRWGPVRPCLDSLKRKYVIISSRTNKKQRARAVLINKRENKERRATRKIDR